MTDAADTTASDRQLLGEIETRIAGRQYHDGYVEPGEPVALVREPDNPHDSQALRIDNQRNEPAGYLPRNVAAWLAPLLDVEKIAVEGYVPCPAERDASRTIPLRLAVFATPAGLDALQKPAIESRQEVCHGLAWWAYEQTRRIRDPELIRDLTRRVRSAMREPLLPETHLLLALLPAIARELHVAKGFEAAVLLRELMGRLTFGRPQHYHNLTVLPLIWPETQEPPYELIQTAIERKEAEVGEVDEDGQVSRLRVTNRAGRPLLVPEGAILIGAKQNRMVNVTVLVAAASEFALPVTCVEQGRWGYQSKHMAAAACASTSLRRRNLRAVHRSREATGQADGDQGGVWQSVAAHLECFDICSETASFTDGLTAVDDRLHPYRQHLTPPGEAAGVVVARGDEVVGVELFDSPRTFAATWPQRSAAFFLDALADESPQEEADIEHGKRFLDRVADCARPRVPAIGLGDELEFRNGHIIGGALLFGGCICHLSAFSTAE
ncbi:MAG: HIRAN domain-containing protein [Thermoguttaceae bacterium]|jgi:hypothetical protein|nr:HIRAN domain-containing protein [Thermoguttaceae bacterium]